MPGFRLSRIAFFVALVALAARAMVPAGWMPSATPDGRLTFALCSGNGDTQGWVDADGKIHKGKPAKAMPDKPCAFSGAGVALASYQLPAEPAPCCEALGVAIGAPTQSPGRGLAAPPPPSTGPPALV